MRNLQRIVSYQLITVKKNTIQNLIYGMKNALVVGVSFPQTYTV
jgi:hypothetical protein